MIYETLEYMILTATSVTFSFSDYIPVTLAFSGTLRCHHSALAHAVPSTYCASPSPFTQLDLSHPSGLR